MGTNAIEEMAAEVLNITLDTIIYQFAKDDLNGVLSNPETFKDGLNRIIAAGISGALVGLAGGVKSTLQGISDSESRTVDGIKISRLQDFTVTDFMGEIAKGVDGDANKNKVIESLLKKGFTEEQIKASTEYKRAQQQDDRNQMEFVKRLSQT